MKNTIELCNRDLKKSIFNDIMFFSLAEGGAMGEPGGVFFFDKKGQTYHFNYVFGDADMGKQLSVGKQLSGTGGNSGRRAENKRIKKSCSGSHLPDNNNKKEQKNLYRQHPAVVLFYFFQIQSLLRMKFFFHSDFSSFHIWSKYS